LEDVFGTTKWPEKLRAAGFTVTCYANHFTDKEGKPEKSVKDPKIIQYCQKRKYVLITTDKQLCYTHIETVKKSDIVIVATESNTSGMEIWVNALIKAKARIERLVKKSERPCSARLSRVGTITVDDELMGRTTRRNRPEEGQERHGETDQDKTS
jgi:hypothetical protein